MSIDDRTSLSTIALKAQYYFEIHKSDNKTKEVTFFTTENDKDTEIEQLKQDLADLKLELKRPSRQISSSFSSPQRRSSGYHSSFHDDRHINRSVSPKARHANEFRSHSPRHNRNSHFSRHNNRSYYNSRSSRQDFSPNHRDVSPRRQDFFSKSLESSDCL
ncbi:hypothetical protein SNE40_022215 [Patella caerulea]|uniref:Uncharacterized protein n=1 Tax=Patella caerulea TaxID=87958 RepID=A0AAN8FZW9_PATCE